MTDVAIASTALTNGEAGEDLGAQIRSELKGETPDALIVFASAENDYGALLGALGDAVAPRTMVGCSSAGEFTSCRRRSTRSAATSS